MIQIGSDEWFVFDCMNTWYHMKSGCQKDYDVIIWYLGLIISWQLHLMPLIPTGLPLLPGSWGLLGMRCQFTPFLADLSSPMAVHLEMNPDQVTISQTVFKLEAQILQNSFTLIWIVNIWSGHYFAHVMTSLLSWHLQNCDLIKSLFHI